MMQEMGRIPKSGNKKEMMGIVSGLMFAILGAFICTILFSGEARTYGQLVSVTLGSTIGPTTWWKSKSDQIHIAIIVMMVVITILTLLRQRIIFLLSNIKLKINPL